MSVILKDEINQLNQAFDGLLQRSESETIHEVGAYVLNAPGKRIRPSLVFLAGKIFNGVSDKLIQLALAVEFLHNATLLHDDVIDHAESRRGKETVNKKWSVDVAILVADYMFSNAFDIAMNAFESKVVQKLIRVTSRMCEGELFQLKRKNTFLSLPEYFKIIESKTALLFAACTSLGALISGADKDQTKSLGQVGRAFGMAFQIRDDILDYEGDPIKAKKDIGNDFSEGKLTLPLIYAFQAASDGDKDKMKHIFLNEKSYSAMMEYVIRYEGIEQASRKVKEYCDVAIEMLHAVPGNDYSIKLKEWIREFSNQSCIMIGI